MQPLLYDHPGARIAFYVVLGAFVVLEQRIRLRSWREREGERADRGTFFVLVACIGAGVGGAFVLAGVVTGAAIAGARGPVFVAGVVVMAGGIVLRQWAVALLGRYFTVDVRVHAGQRIVEEGPYRWMRHPSYSGLLVTLTGLGLALGNWAALAVVVVVPSVGLVVRIHAEEQALMAGLGEPYRRFAATRKRLVPGLW